MKVNLPIRKSKIKKLTDDNWYWINAKHVAYYYDEKFYVLNEENTFTVEPLSNYYANAYRELEVDIDWEIPEYYEALSGELKKDNYEEERRETLLSGIYYCVSSQTTLKFLCIVNENENETILIGCDGSSMLVSVDDFQMRFRSYILADGQTDHLVKFDFNIKDII